LVAEIPIPMGRSFPYNQYNVSIILRYINRSNFALAILMYFNIVAIFFINIAQ